MRERNLVVDKNTNEIRVRVLIGPSGAPFSVKVISDDKNAVALADYIIEETKDLKDPEQIVEYFSEDFSGDLTRFSRDHKVLEFLIPKDSLEPSFFN